MRKKIGIMGNMPISNMQKFISRAQIANFPNLQDYYSIILFLYLIHAIIMAYLYMK